jgi:Mn-dependent DtxR family transcriptional regulator
MTSKEIAELLGKPTITPDELAKSGIFPLSRNGIYQAIERGEIEAIKIGRKKAVVTASLRKKLGIETAA